MARDFIYIDSDKVKETLKDVLEMGEGDMSGNKLGLSSHIVPTVILNRVPEFKLYTRRVTGIQNTWYDIVDLSNVEVVQIGVFSDGNAETIECEVTIDGEVVTGTQNFGANEYRMLNIYGTMNHTDGLTAVFGGDTVQMWIWGYGSPLKARRFKVRTRKTTAVGAGDQSTKVLYNQG